MVENVDTAIAFYTQYLGFTLLTNHAPAFADVTRDNLRLLLPPAFASVKIKGARCHDACLHHYQHSSGNKLCIISYRNNLSENSLFRLRDTGMDSSVLANRIFYPCALPSACYHFIEVNDAGTVVRRLYLRSSLEEAVQTDIEHRCNDYFSLISLR